ncbi:TPA: ETX/MTX2 family pore-forming toxin [Bacillus cereus]
MLKKKIIVTATAVALTGGIFSYTPTSLAASNNTLNKTQLKEADKQHMYSQQIVDIKEYLSKYASEFITEKYDGKLTDISFSDIEVKESYIHNISPYKLMEPKIVSSQTKNIYNKTSNIPVKSTLKFDHQVTKTDSTVNGKTFNHNIGVSTKVTVKQKDLLGVFPEASLETSFNYGHSWGTSETKTDTNTEVRTLSSTDEITVPANTNATIESVVTSQRAIYEIDVKTAISGTAKITYINNSNGQKHTINVPISWIVSGVSYESDLMLRENGITSGYYSEDGIFNSNFITFNGKAYLETEVNYKINTKIANLF